MCIYIYTYIYIYTHIGIGGGRRQSFNWFITPWALASSASNSATSLAGVWGVQGSFPGIR